MIEAGIYEHYKGQRYRVYDVATHSETGECVVVYRCLYDQYDLWVRPLSMFEETVIVDGNVVSRFKLIDSDNVRLD